MEDNFMSILIKAINILNEPNKTDTAKIETIKALLKYSIDVQPYKFGENSRQDLKDLIDVATNWQTLYVEISEYFNTHNLAK